MSFLDDWKEWSTGKKAISIIIVCCIGLIIIALIGGALISDKNTTPNTTIDVKDISISSSGYGGYKLTCNVIPDKDYSYLEAQIIFYDSDNAVIDKSPLVWNMNDVKSNQTIKVTGNTYVQGDSTPTHAKVLFFDKSFSNDESNAIFTQDVQMK